MGGASDSGEFADRVSRLGNVRLNAADLLVRHAEALLKTPIGRDFALVS